MIKTPVMEGANRYQLLELLEPAPKEKTEQLAGIIDFTSPAGPSLLYVPVDQLTHVTRLLDKFGLRTIVLPDYVFISLVNQIHQLDARILNIEFAVESPLMNQAFDAITKEHLGKNDYAGLSNFLQQIKLPIRAIQFTDGRIRIKIYGSGLIIIEGDAEVVKERVSLFFHELSKFLWKVLAAL
jgi:hypothetical protein